MRQELTIFSAGAIFIVLVALIVTISTAVSSMIVIFNGHPQLSNAICEAAGFTYLDWWHRRVRDLCPGGCILF